MKRYCALMLAGFLVCMTVSGMAEGSLSDFANRLKKAAEPVSEAVELSGETDGLSFGPVVRSNDPFFEKVRSSAYLYEGKYSKEMNVLIELKNKSGRTLYPGTATVSAYSESGDMLEERKYSSVGPAMVKDGESLFIWERFYSPEYELSEVSYFTAVVETETSSYRSYETIKGEALADSGIAYALVQNSTENDIYGVRAVVVVEDEEKILLDVCEIETGNGIGIFPGSVMILRGNIADHANDAPLATGTASAYVLYQLDR